MMRQRARAASAAALLVLFVSAAARADRVDDYVREQMRRRHVPGLALAVVRGGRVIKARGYGLASVEWDAPATPETVFEIGSITKQLTAAAVMLLVEDGRVSLDDPLAKYVPEAPDAWRDVRVRHLLTHTSGLRNYTGLKGFELTERLTRAQFVRLVAEHPLAFAPGERWSYGNTNYSLLGYVVESASGRPYWEFVAERIYRPLGMTSTTDRDPRQVVKRRATGYEWEGGRLVGRDYDLTDVFSAGATLSTVLDLAKWDAALYGERILKRASLEQVWTPTRLNGGETVPYGFGWYVENFRGHRRVRHTGQTAGFAASIVRYTDDRLTFIVLCNLGDIGLAGEFTQGLTKLYFPDTSLRALKLAPDPDPQATRALAGLFEKILAGDAAGPRLSGDARTRLSSPRAKERWREVASYGPVRSFVFAGAEASGRNRAARYRAEVGRRLLLVRFTLDPEGQVVDLALEEEE